MGAFEPWHRDAGAKFGVSVSVVAEHFRPEDVTRLDRVFKGRALDAYPLARELGAENCFLRAFDVPELPVPFLVEHLDDAISTAASWQHPGGPDWRPVPDRAVSGREFLIVSAQAKRLAASLRALGPSVLAMLLWQREEREYGERAEPLLATLDDIADTAAGNRWCLPQLTRRTIKRDLEYAIAEELALHHRLSAYRDGLTAKVLRVAYAAAGFRAGADPSRTLRAMVRQWPASAVAAKLSMRQADFERVLRDAREARSGGRLPGADPYDWFRQLVWGRVYPQDSTPEDVPF